MSHRLKRFSKSLLEQPQLISLEKFQEIAEFLDARNSASYEKAYNAALEANLLKDKEYKSDQKDIVESKVGVLRVQGPTTYKATGWEALCGGCSYEQLLKDMDYLCSLPEVEDILLEVDSPGGEAFGAFYCGRALRRKADDAGKRLIAYVDGISASAGYIMGSSAHEVVCSPDSKCGSIGVVVSLMDRSEQMKKEGIKPVFITAGKSKIPYEEDMSFKEDFLQDLQESVTETYEEFLEYVSEMRGIDKEVARNTEAKMFSSKKSLELGLVDSVMNPEEFYTYLSGELASPQQLKYSNEEETELSNVAETQEELIHEDNTIMADANVTPEMLAELQAQMEELAAKNEALMAKNEEYAAKEHEEKLSTLTTEVAKFGLSNTEEIVTALDANTCSPEMLLAALTEMSEKHATILEEKQEKFNTELSEVKQEAENAKLEAEKVKEEFAAPQGFEGDNTSLEDTEKDAKKSNALAEFIKQKHNL